MRRSEDPGRGAGRKASGSPSPLWHRLPGHSQAWVGKIQAQAGGPQTTRDLADSMGPLAEKSALRAEVEFAEPDDLYVVGRLRLPVPEHPTGPSAASYPPLLRRRRTSPRSAADRPASRFPACPATATPELATGLSATVPTHCEQNPDRSAFRH